MAISSKLVTRAYGAMAPQRWRPLLRNRTARCFTSESMPNPTRPLPSGPSTAYKDRTHPDDFSLTNPSQNTHDLLADSAKYLLPVYDRPPIVVSHGRGAYLWDTQGRKYLDFTSGIAVNALGHADEGVAECMATEARSLLHSSNVHYNKWAAALAKLIITLTQREGGLGWSSGSLPQADLSPSPSAAEASDFAGAKVFFANSGTEANEGALKIARKLGKDRCANSPAGAGGSPGDPACQKFKIVCFENAFHGRSMGSLSVTPNPKYQKPFAPLIPGIEVGKLNDFDGLNDMIRDDTCAVIVEPVQGEGGIHIAETTWLRAIRNRCDEVGAVLIYDEIQCGLYRTGALWAHSALPPDCHPDIVTMAKPLANGYPIGAVLMRDSIAQTMTAGTHGTTFGGSPLACALGYHVLSRISERSFVAQINDTSAYLLSRLSLLPVWFPKLIAPEPRGRGLIVGMPFVNEQHPGVLREMARERGVLLLTAGKDAVRLVPSLNITKDEVDVAMDVIESCLGEMAK